LELRDVVQDGTYRAARSISMGELWYSGRHVAAAGTSPTPTATEHRMEPSDCGSEGCGFNPRRPPYFPHE